VNQRNFVDDMEAANTFSQASMFADNRDEQIRELLASRKPGLVYTWDVDERAWIINIARLHAPYWFDLDPTYGAGGLWEGLPHPLHKSDISPVVDDVREADACHLPHHGNQSLRSIMFDPPFVVGRYESMRDLWTFYARALTEFYRILRPKGVLVFKCQDTVDAGRNYMSHAAIIDMAEKIGFYHKDLFVLARAHALIFPNVRPDNQQHGRKTHCFYLVFVKETRPDKTKIGQVDQILRAIKC